MLTRHDIRARLACERGQATVNWLAVMVGLTALAAALVLALPSVAPKVTCAMQNAVAKVSGGAVPDCNHTSAIDADVPDPSTCVVSERSGEAGVTVTVFSVKGGAKVTLITRRTADGKVYVTVQGGGEIGLEFGPPAGGEVTLDTGSGSTTEGANAKGGVKAVGNGSVTWVFPNEDKAHEFAQIVANKARDAALDTNPITGIGRRIIGVGEDRPIPAPSIFGLEGGARIFGDAEGGAGPLSGSAEGEIGPSIGGRYDANSHQTTVYFKLNASGNVGGELIKTIGGRGLGEAELQLAVTVDSKRPRRSRPRSSARARSTRSSPASWRASAASRASPASAPTCAWTSTSPTRPTARPSPTSSRTRSSAPPISSAASRTTRRSACAFTTPARPTWASRPSGSVADVEFGLDVGGNYKTADVQSAYYYDRETGSFLPWVECKR